ncbi:hypothetical protein H0H92_013384, partial [Tricholoma furcatifolium]
MGHCTEATVSYGFILDRKQMDALREAVVALGKKLDGEATKRCEGDDREIETANEQAPEQPVSAPDSPKNSDSDWNSDSDSASAPEPENPDSDSDSNNSNP